MTGDGSLFGDLLQRKEEIAREKVQTVPFPGWSKPSLHLRVKPIDWATARRIRDVAAQSGRRQKAESELRAEASVVAAATVAVIIGGDTELSLRDLGSQHLKLPDGFDLADVVLALAITDGDVFVLAEAVGELSGFKNQTDLLNTELAGE